MTRIVRPTDLEVSFDPSDFLVSKTDMKGRITYVNRVFCEVSGYGEAELLGAPHSVIRHPDMPRAVFKLLWDAIQDGREIFAYVKNMSRSGAYYWVFAHVTPSFDTDHKVVGFHSNRRAPDADKVRRVIVPLYADVLRAEQAHRNGKDALAAGYQRLIGFVQAQGVSYDELIFSI
jgi:PAS domain S-box-containing protein